MIIPRTSFHHTVSTLSYQSYPIHAIPFQPNLLFNLLDLLILIVIVLSWIGYFILQHLDELVEHHRDDGAETWTYPVDPVLDVKHSGDDTRTKAARGIEGATRVVDADELGDEEGKADADGGYEGRWRVSVIVGLSNGWTGANLCVSLSPT